jgi:hypothetical protein
LAWSITGAAKAAVAAAELLINVRRVGLAGFISLAFTTLFQGSPQKNRGKGRIDYVTPNCASQFATRAS